MKSISAQDLAKKFDVEVDRVANALLQYPLEERALYGAWITQTYYFVRHTTRFLTIAASKTSVDDRAGHYDWIHHLKGELHHDQVALNDIVELGFKPEDFPETIETSLLYQSQYFWLDRYSPSSLIGYALLLEGLACKHGPELLSRISVHGDKCTSFLRLHCKVDVEHYADGLKTLERIPVAEYGPILRNLEQSSHLYLETLKAIDASYSLKADQQKSQPRHQRVA